MANTGLLILTSLSKAKRILPIIKEHVLKTLYIQYFPEKNVLLSGNYSFQSKWQGIHYAQTVENIYNLASSFSTPLDVRVLLSSKKNPGLSIINTKRPVEIVIFDQTYSKKEANTFIQDCLANTSMECTFITLSEDEETAGETFSDDATDESVYNNVVLGGTFDRLHNGHKILLSEAVLKCSKKLTVGVTDVSMIKGKILWELIEPCERRISAVKEFLEDVDPSLIYNIVPISDMYGPTKDDPSLDMIIVSEETKKGGEKVNELRLQKGLNKLEVHVIKLASDPFTKEHEESKISSSNQRIRLLGTRLRQPEPKPLPQKPYIIGLIGGIASGKSSVAEKLQNLGAGLVNCDRIAHDLYEPGNRCYELIVKHFGTGILRPDGHIDRKALGAVVFNSKEELKKLNSMVWPVILEESKKQIEELHKKGYDIIVMEAAVLIQAKWENVVHEIWTCIVPPEEAIKRVVERNALSEAEAKLRIESQPTTLEQVNAANVVLSTFWSHDVTQEQVQKAWDELMIYLQKQDKR